MNLTPEQRGRIARWANGSKSIAKANEFIQDPEAVYRRLQEENSPAFDLYRKPSPDVIVGIDHGEPGGDQTAIVTRDHNGTISVQTFEPMTRDDLSETIKALMEAPAAVPVFHLCGNRDWQCHCFDPPRKFVPNQAKHTTAVKKVTHKRKRKD